MKILKKKERKKPSFKYSLLTMVVTFGFIMILALGLGASINALFFIAWLIAVAFGLGTGTSYKELQNGIADNCKKAVVPAMIILSVGALVGTWNAAGTVPMIISFGVKTISPNIFPISAFTLCLVTALATGTSWGTFGTAGVALSAIGLSLGVDPVLTAGAVCSGAFFGDTISPASDSPNLAAAVSGVDLFAGIAYQARVTVPSAMICCIMYYFFGLQYAGGAVDNSMINKIAGAIDGNYNMSFIPLIPAIIVITMLVMKIPSIPSLLCGAVSGGIVAIVYQKQTALDTITFFWKGFSIDTGEEFVNTLLNRGGVMGMASTAIMFFLAFGLFGILNAAGIIDSFVEPFTSKMNSKFSLVVSSMLMGVFGTVVGASMNFSYAFAGSIMQPVFDKKGLDRRALMRALGVGCTALAVLIPWSLSTQVAAPFLDVEPLDLIKYNCFLYVSPVVLVLWTKFGKDTKWKSELDSELIEKIYA
ncbi:Na+/H+ antiporter NhaC family protein [Peptococcus simiae]|uniref:Na+/H+ antiporter NhaC family protein n=1 Tax=Peptococcus simiae TaxID=1643805 RepID=UPI003980350B